MSEQHVDLFRLDWLAMTRTFVRRVSLDDPLMVTPSGQSTQIASGWATYFEVSAPHSMTECSEA